MLRSLLYTGMCSFYEGYHVLVILLVVYSTVECSIVANVKDTSTMHGPPITVILRDWLSQMDTLEVCEHERH